MHIVVTGSLGHISKPLTEELIQKGHSVTVISSKSERQKDIESLGATAAIGTIENADFLVRTFAAADVVYTMVPPVNFFDKDFDFIAYSTNLARNYATAIQQSGIKKVIQLSSIGAHTNEGVGMLNYVYEIEKVLNELPDTVSIKFMRPVGFYYNMFAFIPAIKNAGAIFQNYGGDRKDPWVSPLDIANVIAEEIESPFEDSTFRYIASDEASPNEVAKILGEAIGKSDLKWISVPDEQFENNLIDIGFNPAAAKGFTEMNAARRNGKLYEDYERNKPVLGKAKLKDFAKDFAAVYNR